MKINYLIYQDMTPLDLIGAAQVWAGIPGAEAQYIAKSMEPVKTDTGMIVQPTHTYRTAESDPNIFFIPGGAASTIQLAKDPETLEFVKQQGETANWVTSVCTGAIILAAAGLLKGYRATTHWAALPALTLFGAEAEDSRWVIDRNRATGGGVTAGIDFGLALMAEILGEDAAKQAQLAIEYQPAPPFDSGSPKTASPENLAAVMQRFGVVGDELTEHLNA